MADPADLIAWLLTDGRTVPDVAALCDGYCRRLMAAGVPLWRATFHLPKLHPEAFGAATVWRADAETVDFVPVSFDLADSDQYHRSPISQVHKTRQPFRGRPGDPTQRARWPLFDDLAASGATEYWLTPIPLERKVVSCISVSTRDPGGFQDRHLALVAATLPALASVIEVHLGRTTIEDLLDVYVGREARRRILGGQIKLGAGDVVHAVVLMADMRDFSTHMETLPRARLRDLVQGYFQALVGAILDHHGDVLKFMGDGLLAFFPTGGDEPPSAVAARALAAAQAVQARLTAFNRGRSGGDTPSVSAGMSLHVGDVFLGNIGAFGRQDFTVMGPTVNRAARIEGLCRPLGQPVLLSADFVALMPDTPVLDLGRHALKGVGEQTVYAPALTAASPAPDAA